MNRWLSERNGWLSKRDMQRGKGDGWLLTRGRWLYALKEGRVAKKADRMINQDVSVA
jgi:hypothetical protein